MMPPPMMPLVPMAAPPPPHPSHASIESPTKREENIPGHNDNNTVNSNGELISGDVNAPEHIAPPIDSGNGEDNEKRKTEYGTSSAPTSVSSSTWHHIIFVCFCISFSRNVS